MAYIFVTRALFECREERITFEYNVEINHRFTKYLKEIYRLGSDEHYSFKYFTKSTIHDFLFEVLVVVTTPS